MTIRYTPELLEYMDKKKNHTILVELVEINNSDLEVIDLHVYLPHKNQREKFLTEKKYRVVTTEVGEVLLPPYPLQLAEEITCNAPLSVQYSKQLLIYAQEHSLDEAFAKSDEYSAIVFSSEDSVEGPRAFAEKRAPVWKGR